MVFESLLNNTFNVYSPRRTADGSGGWSIDYVLEGTVVGRIRPATSREREVAVQQQREVSHVFYTTHPSPVIRGYRLTLSSLVVEVQAVREPSKAGEHVEVDCQEVQLEELVDDGS